MTRRKKLVRFDEIREMAHVYEAGCDRAGKWGSPVVLELACAAGQYTLDLGRRSPGIQHVGVDRKGDRLWRGATLAEEEGLTNVSFLRINIEDLEEYFAEDEVSEIWITFPDPRPRPCKSSQRLTSERFLPMYQKILKQGGVVHLKTDNLALFEFSLLSVREFGGEVVEEIRDVHSLDVVPELLQILTYYENKFIALGMPIYYAKFTLHGTK